MGKIKTEEGKEEKINFLPIEKAVKIAMGIVMGKEDGEGDKDTGKEGAPQ